VIYGEGPYADVLREFVASGPAAWIAQQTQLGPDGAPKSAQSYAYVSGICASLDPGTLVVISTQLPVGSCARLEADWPDLRFAVQPENVRAASAHDDFLHTARFVVGSRHPVRDWFIGVFAPYTQRVLFMSPESAEMTKHALNGFLALCIRYGNDIGRLCELWGANPDDVVAAVLADRRVGDAPIRPGGPPSQHLLREVHTLIELGAGPTVRSLV
jgi:UDPglucose 6-dehydrogenase